MMKDAPVVKKSQGTLPGSPAPKNWNAPPESGGAKKSKPPSEALQKLRELMWQGVGIMRSGKELKHAIDSLAAMEIPQSPKNDRADHELRNLHAIGSLIARSALAREESRGSHYRSDFPYRDDDEFQKHSVISKSHNPTFEK